MKILNAIQNTVAEHGLY